MRGAFARRPRRAKRGFGRGFYSVCTEFARVALVSDPRSAKLITPRLSTMTKNPHDELTSDGHDGRQKGPHKMDELRTDTISRKENHTSQQRKNPATKKVA